MIPEQDDDWEEVKASDKQLMRQPTFGVSQSQDLSKKTPRIAPDPIGGLGARH